MARQAKSASPVIPTVPTPRKLSGKLARTRDESMVVDIEITKKGCFHVPNSKFPGNVVEYDIGDKITVSVGRADGMAGKIKILGEPRKADA